MREQAQNAAHKFAIITTTLLPLHMNMYIKFTFIFGSVPLPRIVTIFPLSNVNVIISEVVLRGRTLNECSYTYT